MTFNNPIQNICSTKVKNFTINCKGKHRGGISHVVLDTSVMARKKLLIDYNNKYAELKVTPAVFETDLVNIDINNQASSIEVTSNVTNTSRYVTTNIRITVNSFGEFNNFDTILNSHPVVYVCTNDQEWFVAGAVKPCTVTEATANSGAAYTDATNMTFTFTEESINSLRQIDPDSVTCEILDSLVGIVQPKQKFITPLTIEILQNDEGYNMITIPLKSTGEAGGGSKPVYMAINDEEPVLYQQRTIDIKDYPVGTKIKLWGTSGRWNSNTMSIEPLIDSTGGNKFKVSGYLGALLDPYNKQRTCDKNEFRDIFNSEHIIIENLELPSIIEPNTDTFYRTFTGCEISSVTIPYMPLYKSEESTGQWTPFRMMFSGCNIKELYVYTDAPVSRWPGTYIKTSFEYLQWVKDASATCTVYVKDPNWLTISRSDSSVLDDWNVVLV